VTSIKTAEQVRERDRRRSGRKREVRFQSVRTARASKRTIEWAKLRLAVMPRELPETRGDCVTGPRPCPYVSCKHHLYLDVSPRTGTIKLNFPDLEVWELKHSCSLDVAQAGGVRLEDIGELLNITRERARQIEIQAAAAIEESGDLEEYRGDYSEPPLHALAKVGGL